jgi:hypothetical protein
VEQYLIRLNEKECVKVSRHNGYASGSLIEDEDRLEDLTPKLKTKLRHKLFMDLLNARKEAAKKSTANNGKAIYINVDEEGECLLMPNADTTTFAAFKSGHEIAVPIAPQLTKQIFKHKPTKKMRTRPDEFEETSNEEQPNEEQPAKVTKKAAKLPVNGRAKKAAKVITMTPNDTEEEQPTEDSPKVKPSAKRPKTKPKAKALKVSKLAKKRKVVDTTIESEDRAETKKAKSARTHGGKVERKVKTGTKTRQKRSLNLAPKNKPSASDVENAKKQLLAWKKEREAYAKENPKRTAKKSTETPTKKATKKPLKVEEKKPLKPTKKK